MIRRLALGLALAAGLAAPAAAACPPPGEAAVAGFYGLEGLREVGSQFILHPDGRFEFMLAYGAIDQYGRGCWTTKHEGWVVLLPPGRSRVPTVTLPTDRRFRGLSLIREPDGGLRWQVPGETAIYRRSGG